MGQQRRRQHPGLTEAIGQPGQLRAATASATANPPVTSPAVAYEPVRACTSQTIPKLVIAIPTRPTAAVRKKAAAPGARNKVR
jgi:hypothetical protein